MANGFQGQTGQKVPEMTPEVVAGITDRYIELFEHITGEKFDKVEYSQESIKANVSSWIASQKG